MFILHEKGNVTKRIQYPNNAWSLFFLKNNLHTPPISPHPPCWEPLVANTVINIHELNSLPGLAHRPWAADKATWGNTNVVKYMKILYIIFMRLADAFIQSNIQAINFF